MCTKKLPNDLFLAQLPQFGGRDLQRTTGFPVFWPKSWHYTGPSWHYRARQIQGIAILWLVPIGVA
jgi:hypothetical protein